MDFQYLLKVMANKEIKKNTAEASNPNETPKPQKRRGRPPGSKNKNKTSLIEPSPVEAQPKRKRGRPLGSKNKNKEVKSIASGPKSLSMDLNDIQALISFVSKSGVSEVDLESQGVKIVIKTTSSAAYVAAPVAVPQPVAVQAPVHAAAPAAAPSAQSPVSTAPSVADESKYVTIKSPMIGTFYRRPSPDKPVFVNVGDEIKPGKVLCIIEAMKLFNEIEAEISGKIVKILVDDASPVEYDQPLFLVDPS